MLNHKSMERKRSRSRSLSGEDLATPLAEPDGAPTTTLTTSGVASSFHWISTPADAMEFLHHKHSEWHRQLQSALVFDGSKTDTDVFAAYVATTPPLHLAFEWDVSLNEAALVQRHCGRAVLHYPLSSHIAAHGGAADADCRSRALLDALDGDKTIDAVSWVRCALSSANARSTVDRPETTDARSSGVFSKSKLRIVSVCEQIDATAYVGTGSQDFDRMLHGGLQCGLITEIVGRPAVGKSTLILNWVAHASVIGALADRVKSSASVGFPPTSLAHGVESCVIVQAGPSLSCAVLQQLIGCYARLACSQHKDIAAEEGDILVGAMRRIRCVTVNSLSDFSDTLPLLRDALGSASSNQSRLLVVDSFAVLVHNWDEEQRQLRQGKHISAAASYAESNDASLQRHAVISQCTQALKDLAESCRTAVVITNFVSAYARRQRDVNSNRKEIDDVDGEHESTIHWMSDDEHDDDRSRGAGSRGAACGAFGNTFFHAVNNRFVVEDIVADGAVWTVLRVVKSPVCPAMVFPLQPRRNSQSASSAASDDSIAPFLLKCSVGNDVLQSAAAALAAGAVSAPANPHYVGDVSYMMAPLWI